MESKEIRIIGGEEFKRLDSRLESLGIIKSEEHGYQTVGLFNVEYACKLAKQDAEQDLLRKAREMGADYLRLLPNKWSADKMYAEFAGGTEQAVGEAYQLKVLGGKQNER